MPDPRYPLGPFRDEGPADAATRAARIDRLAAQPARLERALAGLDDRALDLPFRDGGWTLRQIAHHVPESHLNAYTRVKLALTEDRPVIKPYDEAAWARLADARTGPVGPSIRLLAALHERWVLVLRGMAAEDFARTFFHPEQNAERSLDWLLALYAWHGDHHAAQVEAGRARAGL